MKVIEGNFSEVLGDLNDVIVYVDRKGKILDVSGRLEEMLGYKTDEVIGRNFFKLGIISLDNLPRITKLFSKAILKGEIVNPVEMKLKKRNGSSISIEASTRLLKENGRITGVVSVLRDITERKSLEDNLIKLNNCFLKFGADANKNISIIVETAGGLLGGVCALYNKLEGDTLCTLGKWQAPTDMPLKDRAKGHICFDVISYGKEHFIIRNLEESLYAESDPNVKKYNLKTYIGHVVKVKDKPVGSLCVVYQKDKEFMQYEVEVLSILAKALGIEEERKRMGEDLIHSERMAGIGQLAAGIAHEFNNLLNIIEGTAEYAKSIKNARDVKESLDIILKSSYRGADIVKGLLRFAGRTEVRKEFADISEMLEEVLHLVKRDLEKSSIKLAVNYSDVPKILVDVGQIQQVFLNLVSNAQNAMPKGGKLSINLRKKGAFIEAEFHNTGKIIKKEDLLRLFTPFFTTREQQENGWPGTGLGLSISYGIIQAHGGKIEVKSQKGKGTTFTVKLPIAEKSTGIGKQFVKQETMEKDGKCKLEIRQAEILIIDDEVQICNLFKRLLEKEGHIVTIANDGRSAVKICGERKFDLIYMDIVMPGMDGTDAFDKILKADPGAKVVFVTGKLMEDKVAEMFMGKGAVGFLRKPISMSKLIDYTRSLLAKKNE